MRHAVLAQEDPACPATRHSAQAVMRGGDAQPGREAGEPERRLEQDPARKGKIGRRPEKAAAEGKIRIVLFKRCNQDGNILCPVLAVSIESDYKFRILAE